MSVTESKLKNGILTLKGVDGSGAAVTVTASCQAQAASIRPGRSDDKAESLEVLCGDVLQGSGSSQPADNLVLSAIQDWSKTDGFSAFTWTNRDKTVHFEFTPAGADPANKWTGDCTVVLPQEVGGSVNQRLTADLEWPITSLTPPTGFGAGYGSKAPTGLAAPTGGGKEWTLVPTGAAKPANLAALKADPVIGDSGTAKPAAAFGAGEFITLGDGTKANFTTVWVAGVHA